MSRIFIYLFVLASLAFSFVTNVYAKTGSPGKEMAEVLAATAKLAPKPIETLSAADARIQPTIGDGAQVVLAKKGKVADMTGLEKVYNLEIKTTTGALPARVYKPKGENLPVVVYFQGGGFVIADLDTYDGSAFAIAKKSNSIVVSVEYRKAPEHKFPAAHDDAFFAYKWALANAKSLGGDAAKVAVAGESAGGNLAVNVAIRARDEGAQAPTHVLAIYPVAGVDMNTESYKENAEAKPLNKPMMPWFFKNYVGQAVPNDPRINLLAADLKGLPATTIILAEIDPLRTEGEKLAAALTAVGVSTQLKLYKGATHEFFGLADVVPQAAEAQKFAAAQLMGAESKVRTSRR